MRQASNSLNHCLVLEENNAREGGKGIKSIFEFDYLSLLAGIFIFLYLDF
jgi:hypothetical protein